MVDYVLQTVNLDVFGGPTSLDVSTDFGKTGDRGTRVWVGTGNPASVLTANQDVKLYDLFINTNPVDQFYSWLYQYVPEVGTPTWSRVLKLNPSQYSKVYPVLFTAGVGVLDIPVSVITSDTTTATIDKFIFRYNFENNATNPIASSFTYEIYINPTTGIRSLRITFKAIEYNGTTWTNLSSSYKVHTFVSYIS